MRIDHLAIWVSDLEGVKEFYQTYFDAKAGPLYNNPNKNFTSYFLYFKDSSTRLELMHNPEIADHSERNKIGLAHFAISAGDEKNVNLLTNKLRKDSFRIISEPTTTGDGYYESVVLDPEGNIIEITV